MTSIKHKYSRSVEKHMLASKKVWGLILSQGVPLFCCPVLIDTSFMQKLQGKTQIQNTGGTLEM